MLSIRMTWKYAHSNTMLTFFLSSIILYLLFLLSIGAEFVADVYRKNFLTKCINITVDFNNVMDNTKDRNIRSRLYEKYKLKPHGLTDSQFFIVLLLLVVPMKV